jgi:peptidoglycan/xylan/chitin deacetylase (PgdA/CDA1 family)
MTDSQRHKENTAQSVVDSALVAPQRDFPPLTAKAAFRSSLRHNSLSLAAGLLTPLGRRAPEGAYGVLMYHRVTPNPKDYFPPSYSVTPTRFEKQLVGLLNRGFQCWSLERLLDSTLAQQPIPPRVFAITFDDGFENNYSYALPILQKLQLPATIFLATAYLDSDKPYPFDCWAAQPTRDLPPETWKPLSRSQCHELNASELITLGAHTHTHADFRQAPAALEHDLVTCCEILRHEFGISQPLFSFPFGVPELGFASAELGATARSVGCRCAFQIGNSLATPSDDLFALPRFDVASRESGRTLAAKLDGWYEHLTGVLRKTLVHKKSGGPS